MHTSRTEKLHDLLQCTWDKELVTGLHLNQKVLSKLEGSFGGSFDSYRQAKGTKIKGPLCYEIQNNCRAQPVWEKVIKDSMGDKGSNEEKATLIVTCCSFQKIGSLQKDLH